MNTDQIIEKVKNSPSSKVKVAVTDIDGVLRGKYIHKNKFLSVIDDGFGFCDVVFGWDSSDVLYENSTFTGWHTGFPDAPANIDLSTFREVPWDNNVPFFLADFSKNNLEVCPRTLLRKINKQTEDLGYRALFSQEYEWFNFGQSSVETHDKSFTSLNPITRGMFGYSLLRASEKSEFFNDLFDLLEKFNISLEGLHTETGPGVYEAAIAYGPILEMADKSVLFKTAVKEIGQRHGIMPTFMAKWNAELPGSSGHIHQSLWDDKKNLFFDENAPHNMSATMKSFIAGQLHCLPKILPMYAPTVNSFKRLVEGAWAPTTLTWGVDNRTTALRALPGSKNSTRIELRVPGADMNPYLAMSAALASGMYGVKNNLSLDIPATKENGYSDKSNGILPGNLKEATDQMKSSELSRELFGDEFVNHFCETREWEWKQQASAVTDWELKRYFEII